MADVVLVGLPGSGKTTTGRALAQALGRHFVDTDDVFLSREHESVQDFLRGHAESEFREREVLALQEAITSPGVVATGGGVVVSLDARRALSGALTVWLDSPDDVLVRRLSEGDRPLLGDQPAVRIGELRAQREDFYAEVSRWRVDSARPIEQVVAELRTILETAQATS